MIWAYAALAAAILAGVGGQLLLKAGSGAESFVAQLMRPTTIGGLVLYGCGAFFYIVALRKLPVSVAFPTVALSYAVVAVLGHYFWSEPFGLPQIGGIALIVAGVLLLNQG